MLDRRAASALAEGSVEMLAPTMTQGVALAAAAAGILPPSRILKFDRLRHRRDKFKLLPGKATDGIWAPTAARARLDVYVNDAQPASERVTVHIHRIGLLGTELQDALPQSAVLRLQSRHLILQLLRVLSFARARPSGALPVLYLRRSHDDVCENRTRTWHDVEGCHRPLCMQGRTSTVFRSLVTCDTDAELTSARRLWAALH